LIYNHIKKLQFKYVFTKDTDYIHRDAGDRYYFLSTVSDRTNDRLWDLNSVLGFSSHF